MFDFISPKLVGEFFWFWYQNFALFLRFNYKLSLEKLHGKVFRQGAPRRNIRVLLSDILSDPVGESCSSCERILENTNLSKLCDISYKSLKNNLSFDTNYTPRVKVVAEKIPLKHLRSNWKGCERYPTILDRNYLVPCYLRRVFIFLHSKKKHFILISIFFWVNPENFIQID